MIKDFGVTKSSMIFKLYIVKSSDNYQKLKKSTLLLHLMKYYFKKINEICKGSASEFSSISMEEKIHKRVKIL